MSDKIAKCVLRVEVNETTQNSGNLPKISFKIPLHLGILLGAQAVPNVGNKKKNRGQRKIRDISVETFPSRLENARDDWGLLPKCSRENTPGSDKSKESGEEKTEIGFFSGNPFVEITKGILHLYKEE